MSSLSIKNFVFTYMKISTSITLAFVYITNVEYSISDDTIGPTN